MKVRLILDIDVPVSNLDEARDEIWQAIVKDSMVYHLTQAIEWHCKDPPEEIVNEVDIERWNVNTKSLVAYHRTWASIIEKAKYVIE